MSAQNLSVDITSSSGKTVSAQTVRNVLHSAKIYGRTARKKPFIKDKNKQKRFGFVKAYFNKSTEFWKNVIFSDESKYNIFGSNGTKFVWRTDNGLGLYVVQWSWKLSIYRRNYDVLYIID